MSTFSGRTLATAVVAALGLVAATAVAQQAPDSATGPGDKAQHLKHFGDDAPPPSQMIEARLAFIRTALQITPEQTPQWNAVADAMRKQAKARDAEMQAFRAQQDENNAPPDPIERLEHRQKALTTASANLAEMIDVWKPLYASLSDSQKAIAARLIAGHEHHDWRREMPR
jgi:ABC-type sugar transport system substrate-binding protein